MDAEVLRLRKLRHAALRARALAKRLDGGQGRGDSIFSKTAVTCWGISRFITGYLSGHPDLRCQKGPSGIREFFDGLDASAIALVTHNTERRISLATAGIGARRPLSGRCTGVDPIARNKRRVGTAADKCSALGRTTCAAASADAPNGYRSCGRLALPNHLNAAGKSRRERWAPAGIAAVSFWAFWKSKRPNAQSPRRSHGYRVR